MSDINTIIVDNFNRRFRKIFKKRKVELNEHIAPIFRYLNVRVGTCKIGDLDTYEYLVNDLSTKFSEQFPELQNKIESSTQKILKQIRKRRECAERKVEESRLKIGPIEEKRRRKNFLRNALFVNCILLYLGLTVLNA